tara:strand:- start:4355 stop:5593 length:1239 start_codon:yes stop_codon:yes gene_type:complete
MCVDLPSPIRTVCCLFSLCSLFFATGCPKQQVSVSSQQGRTSFVSVIAACQKARQRRPTLKQPLFYMARIYEQMGEDDKALSLYKRYLTSFQSPALTRYLQKGQVQIRRHLGSRGVSWIATRINAVQTGSVAPKLYWGRAPLQIQWALKKSVGVEREKVTELSLLRVHRRMARLYRKRKQRQEMDNAYFRVFLLSEEMMRHFVKTRRAFDPIKPTNAEARFYMAEYRRKIFQQMPFVLYKKLEPELIKNMRIRFVRPPIGEAGLLLAHDYMQVFPMKVNEWSWAANFRRLEIQQLLAQKALRSKTPPSLPTGVVATYEKQVKSLAMLWLRKARKGYASILQNAVKIELYTPWVERGMLAYQRLVSKNGGVLTSSPWWSRLLRLREQFRQEQKSSKRRFVQLTKQMKAKCLRY